MQSAMKGLDVIDIGDIHKLFGVLDNLDFRIKRIEKALENEGWL